MVAQYIEGSPISVSRNTEAKMELRRVGALPRSNADLAARIDGRIEDIKNRARVDEDGTPRGGDFSIPFNFLALVLPELLEPASSSKREATTGTRSRTRRSD